jgi:hypothetical protein
MTRHAGRTHRAGRFHRNRESPSLPFRKRTIGHARERTWPPIGTATTRRAPPIRRPYRPRCPTEAAGAPLSPGHARACDARPPCSSRWTPGDPSAGNVLAQDFPRLVPSLRLSRTHRLTTRLSATTFFLTPSPDGQPAVSRRHRQASDPNAETLPSGRPTSERYAPERRTPRSRS